MDTKMLQEMDMKRKSHGVIARLMGLDDTLPSNSLIGPTKSYVKDGGFSHNYFREREVRDHQLRQFEYDDRFVTSEIHRDGHKNKDLVNAHEGEERPSSRTNCFNDQVLPNGRPSKTEHQKRRSIVPNKLMEAKNITRHGKVCGSKEFDDVLNSLSCNKDLFFKFFEEPNCFFSKHLKELHLIPTPRQAKQITLLKPSNVVETNSEDQLKQHKYDRVWEMHNTFWRSDAVQHRKTEKLSQPTRIVVLKPSPRKHYDSKAQAAPFTSLQEQPEREACHGGLRRGIFTDSRDAAGEFTLKMHDYLSRHCRDEPLLPSVISDGYVGDENSFNMLEGYTKQQDVNTSDSESPSSWHYISNWHKSPCSNSSLSRASHSSESSVLREAKKRMSERCALVAVNGLYQEQHQERNSSTLAEMLAVRELKSEDVNDMGPLESRTCSKEENFRMPAACLSIVRKKSEKEESNINLSSSKFDPTSLLSSDIGLSTDNSESSKDKSVTSKRITKPSRGKTSFKGRVSSLFFLKNKEVVTEKCASSLLASSYDVLPTIRASIVSKNRDDSALVHNSDSRESSLGNFDVALDRISSHHVLHDKEDEIHILTEVTPFDVEPAPSRVISEKLAQNQDHPSPTSILDAPFKDDLNNRANNSSKIANTDNPQALSRSIPIESISRTLSWDGFCSETSSTNPWKLTKACRMAEDNGTEDLLFVQNLLSASGLYGNRQSTIFNGWHSPESPCDPKLLDKLLDENEGAAKSLERRSNQMLLFDRVNLLLLEIGRAAEMGVVRCAMAHKVLHDGAPLASQLELLVRRIRSEVSYAEGESKNGSHVVESLLCREAAGREWSEFLQLEVLAISEEIGLQVLNSLFEEVLIEFSAH